ncbi:Metallo-hydrolase/oxidoreductase [Metschnikowia bicuspidata var. bicuspidata NRRL YB-4993]|uniref:Metallo-hydrolase/oxidoreductase n=1 Tax=Metschnikowia bicuspidata var. bicuspidata NRRL YB-4993 TaxID=869754 RepID=A0A1A0HFZ5_9ASCO|nr:Metallo-hydrolase/oxidoreductase [Metschnikowia bicuspidata var. bicuspidata NRRL YB-4993]OBA22905.1 Metallo-hydrolase/oxidoreductase [Metschnikowia bicuspidata var. bicuspidata NRRL YB-4993]
MTSFFRFTRGTRIGIGALVSYTSFESYMYIKTAHLIQERKDAIDSSKSDENDGRLRFQSATINGIYVNPFEEYRPQTAFEFVYVRILEVLESIYGNKVEMHDPHVTSTGEIAEVEQFLQTFKPNYELLRYNSKILENCLHSGSYEALLNTESKSVPINQQLLFTWLGQSCSLLQISGINILTDPIFSDYLFANNVGPKRLVNSPMSLEDVNYATNDNLNLVLVSHNHPDHLEMSSAQKIGNSALWVVPLGLKLVLQRKGIDNVIEMDWWDVLPLNDHLFGERGSDFPDNYELVFLPAMHWSGRYVVDANTSLWGSFMIRKNGTSLVYHAGDTGFSKELFDKIGQNYGPVTLSLLPIGQYCPSWHQKPRHVSPEECFKIASQIKTSNVMGVHFGTFKLSSEPILEPKELFMKLAELRNKTPSYSVPEFGFTYEYDINRSGQVAENTSLE